MNTDSIIHMFIGVFVMVILVIAIAAGTSVKAPPRAPEELKQQEATARPGESKSGTLCVAPCMGPHLNLSNGRVEFFSVGPGINF